MKALDKLNALHYEADNSEDNTANFRLKSNPNWLRVVNMGDVWHYWHDRPTKQGGNILIDKEEALRLISHG